MSTVDQQQDNEGAEDVSFAELIQLREQQQQQIRKALARQNARLKDKLTQARSESPEFSGGESISDSEEESREVAAPHGEQEQESAAPSQSRSRRRHRRGGGGGVDGPQVTMEAFMEVQEMLSKLTSLVHSQHESDKTAIESLREHIDTRCNGLEEKLSAMEARIAVGEKTTALMREEQNMQQLTLAGDLEALRESTDASARRLDSRDEAVQSAQNIVAQLNETCQSLEERVVVVETFPPSMRQELAEMQDKWDQMSAGFRAERYDLSQKTNDLHAKQEAELQQVLAEARAEYENLHRNAADSVEVIQNARDTIGGLIATGVAEVSERLEKALQRRNEDQEEKIQSIELKQNVNNHKQNELINESLASVQRSVDSSLQSMRQQYDDSVRDQLNSIVEIADEHEAARRAEFPVIDADRVAIMMQELQGAQTMIEGIARNTLSSGDRMSTLAPRLKELEARFDDFLIDPVQARKKALKGANDDGGQNPATGDDTGVDDDDIVDGIKIHVSIPVQTDDLTEDQLPPKERIAAMVERRLANEMDRAEQEQLDAKMWKEIEDAERKMRKASASQQSAGSPLNGGEPSTGRSRSQAPTTLDEVKALTRTKQGQLAKVQEILRQIQEKFHELTQKEAKAAPGKQMAPEARKVAEQIARQKEAVYQHERQLVDQRNHLMHEIKQLQAKQQEMLA